MTTKARILVHICCASCASLVLRRLGERFEATALFFNPNIQPEGEYRLRLTEAKRVCRKLNVPLIAGPYDPKAWEDAIGPYRGAGERSERCWRCYRLRLEETAATAVKKRICIFTTTLSVSPHKVHRRIAEIGAEAASTHGLSFLAEDFKKRDGFRESVALSRSMGLTRQDYCGCLPSLEEAGKRRRERFDRSE
jgi:predicted adenine nucleotide alpha hydrolase (AANH) superfamily ATPase